MGLYDEIEKKFPGKKVVIRGGKIILKAKSSSQRKGTGRTRFSYIDNEKIAEMEKKAIQQGQIYIPYEVMSSKNSRVFEYLYRENEEKKVPVLGHSAQYKEYVALSNSYWAKNRQAFLQLISKASQPYLVGFYFIRTTRQRFDYPNLMQGAMDLMVEHKWLEDDCMDIIKPIPAGYEVNKEHQGLIISVQ